MLLKKLVFNLVWIFLSFGGILKVDAQISITSSSLTYQQNFNNLYTSGTTNYTWTNGNTLPGWYAARSVSGPFTQYTASAGSVTSQGLYILGSSGSSERALGTLNGSEDLAFGALFQNNSGGQINGVTVSFTAEQWRRVTTTVKGHQRTKVSYRIASTIDVTGTHLITDEFVEIPELFLLSLDTTTTTNGAIVGNTAGNFATVSATFPVTLPAGHQFFLRFYDENEIDTNPNPDVDTNDLLLGLDDFTVTFSAGIINRITAASDYSFYAYIEQGVLVDIPTSSEEIYIDPVSADMTSWTSILQNFYTGNWASIATGPYDYQVAQFTSGNQTYFILRKRNTSDYFWGTYVTADTPLNTALAIQAPHPLVDEFSDREAAAVFQFTGASAYMAAGISRCAGGPSSCNGQTSVCGSLQAFRTADVPHAANSIFHLATTTLAQLNASLNFVQLHGFGKSSSEPHFIVSCGTMDGKVKSVPDYPVVFRNAIMNNDPTWDGDTWEVKIPHVDNYSNLAALDNVQGRFLNNYTGDVCSGSADPTTVTNRFLHIEQYKAVREFPVYYDDMANIIASTINPQAYTSHISIGNLGFQYLQDFNLMPSTNATYTWGNNLTLSGWYAAKNDLGLFSEYRTGDGSSSTYGLYSFGSSNSADRALGALNQDASGDIVYGVLFRNNTGSQIDNVTMSYKAEQWRKANSTTVSQRVKVGYLIANEIDLKAAALLNNATTTWISQGDMITIDNGSSNGPVNGNTVFTQINITFPVALENGDEIFIKFFDENVTSTDKAMAVDDLSISFSANPPSAPVSSTATGITQTGFVTNWSASVGATGYRLDVSTSNAFSNFVSGYNDLDVTNVTSHGITGLDPNTAYYYRVRAYNAGGISPNSSTITVQTLVMPPAAPVANTATGIAQTAFSASWASSASATGYRIDISTSDTFSNFVSGYNDLDVSNVTSYGVIDLDANTSYYYRVRAYNAGGISPNSSAITVQTLIMPPVAPIANAATGITQTTLTANWASSASATGYRLDISTSATFSNFVSDYNDLDVTNVTSYGVTALDANATYHYRVRAYNAGGTSPNSSTITAQTLIMPPAAPVANAANGVAQTTFTANWNSSATATGYRLDVSTSNTFLNFVSGYNDLDVTNETSYGVTGLDANTTYYYRVKAYNAGGTSSNSSTITIQTLIIPPIAPISNAATGVSQTTLTANWNSSATATGYRLDVSTSNTFSSFVLGYNDLDVTNITSYGVTGLAANTAYYYRVRAYNGGGTSGSSSTITVQTLVTPPVAPVANAATGVTQTTFTANWNPSTTATGYRLDVSTSNTFSSFVSGYNDLDVTNVTSFGVTGLAANTAYYYRVRAYNGGGTSPNSSTITIQTLITPPVAPVANAATGVSQTTFMANWNSSSTATGYRLDVSINNAFSSFVSGYNNLDVTNVTNFGITGLDANTTYYYRVRAYNTGGISPNSPTITVQTLITPPTTPVSNAATGISQTTFTANWNSSSTATGYRLDVSINNAFSSFVSGYNDLDVTNVTSYSVTGLDANTSYYYRVRAYNNGGASANSSAITVQTLVAIPAAYISINNSDFEYVQDFNSVPSTNATYGWGNNLTLLGWYAANEALGWFSEYRTGNGSSATYGLYSFGSNNSADRALGSLNQDMCGDIVYGVLFKNNTGRQIDNVTMSYKAEQWRKTNGPTVSQRVKLGYVIASEIDLNAASLLNNTAATWVSQGDMITIDNASSNGPVNGNTVFTQININFPVALESGDEILIRFFDENIAGTDKAMAVDDFRISFSTNSSPGARVAYTTNPLEKKNEEEQMSVTIYNSMGAILYSALVPKKTDLSEIYYPSLAGQLIIIKTVSATNGVEVKKILIAK